MSFAKPNERFRAAGKVDESAALRRMDGAETGGDDVANMWPYGRVAPPIRSQGNRATSLIKRDPACFPDCDFSQDSDDRHGSAQRGDQRSRYRIIGGLIARQRRLQTGRHGFPALHPPLVKGIEAP